MHHQTGECRSLTMSVFSVWSAAQVILNRSLWTGAPGDAGRCCAVEGDLFFLGDDEGEIMAAVGGRLLHEMLGAH